MDLAAQAWPAFQRFSKSPTLSPADNTMTPIAVSSAPPKRAERPVALPLQSAKTPFGPVNKALSSLVLCSRVRFGGDWQNETLRARDRPS
jgi:hypothetical protein